MRHEVRPRYEAKPSNALDHAPRSLIKNSYFEFVCTHNIRCIHRIPSWRRGSQGRNFRTDCAKKLISTARHHIRHSKERHASRFSYFNIRYAYTHDLIFGLRIGNVGSGKAIRSPPGPKIAGFHSSGTLSCITGLFR